MQHKPDSPEHHRLRSEFIRKLVQGRLDQHSVNGPYGHPIPRTIVQYWHDLPQLPHDVEECVASWIRWERSGFTHRLFDEHSAKTFISGSLGTRHECAFERCYHPAMQSDYFRLCYLLVEGGFYVDADDVCIGTDIGWLFHDGRLKLQPLCYDIATGAMVKSSVFLSANAYDPNWIFYFNNNPLVAIQGHPIIKRALSQTTMLLELAGEDTLPEIQATTGPGNLSKSIFNLGMTSEDGVESDLVVLRDWDSFAVSKWPLSHRGDARNWRLSNQKRFDCKDG
ncbi:MAG: glycosyltransferase [Chloroflexota bacterium]|nr:glycosyltransferase [Chloroflexota bacterium]